MRLAVIALLSLGLVSELWAFECLFDKRDKSHIEESLNCSIKSEEYEKVKTRGKEFVNIVNRLAVYPVYSKQGDFLKFLSIGGTKFKAGTVLVLKTDRKLSELPYTNFDDFEVFAANDYEEDLACYMSHDLAGIPDEETVMSCIDKHIKDAMSTNGLTKVRSFSYKKLRMIKRESYGLFDTFSRCGGNRPLTFFRGKVYNEHDFGNFVWGAILEKLKVTDVTKKIGSEVNGYLNPSRNTNTGDFKLISLLGDSPRDQKAIFEGARWMRSKKKEPK